MFMHDTSKKVIGIFGLGQFGRLMAKHLAPHFEIWAYDPSADSVAFGRDLGLNMCEPEQVAKAGIVILGPPVQRMRDVVMAIRDHLPKGSLVLDVGSVKYNIAQMLEKELPPHVDIVCTHPLFGPQSGKHGIAGLKIVVCPVRGDDRATKVVSFLKDKLSLEVIVITPEEHDREIAVVMGLSHMISKVLLEMEPLPKRLATKSYEKLLESLDMLRYDSMELFLAIERDNPFSREVRKTFFAKADALRQYLEDHDSQEP